MGPSLQRDGVLRQDRAIDFHASVWLPVLDLERRPPDDGVAARASVTSQTEVVGGQISARLRLRSLEDFSN